MQSTWNPPSDEVMARFWPKVVPTGFCWNWIAGSTHDGYGRIEIAGKKKLAHRLAYEYLVGPIPEGLVIDHLCRNRACVNPDHLEPVTVKVNTHRAMSPNLRAFRSGICKRGHRLDEGRIHPVTGYRSCRVCVLERPAPSQNGLKSGVLNHSAKLNEALVKQMREAMREGRSALSIATEFGVHRSTVYDIRNGQRWVGVGDSDGRQS